jgi:hypothetical protein
MKIKLLLGIAVLLISAWVFSGCDVGPITPPPEEVPSTDTYVDSDADTDQDIENMWRCLICED